jgi:hypothetical protein
MESERNIGFDPSAQETEAPKADVEQERAEETDVSEALVLSPELDFEKLETKPGWIQSTALIKKVLSNITENAAAVFLNRDKYLDEYIQTMDKSIEVSEQGGRLFDTLARNGLAKPDLEHEYKPAHSRIQHSKDKNVRRMLQHRDSIVGNLYARFSDKALIDEEFQPKDQPYRFEEQEKDHKFELFSNVVVQDGGVNTMKEVVNNYLYDTRNSGAANVTIENAETGLRVDLGQLLPHKFDMMPSPLIQFEEVYDKDAPVGERRKSKQVPVSLQKYLGTKGSDGRFAANPEHEFAFYGDLTKKGGVLSYLHEVAHTWQFVHNSVRANRRWEKMFRNVSALIRHLDIVKEERPEDFQMVFDQVTRILEQEGIEISPDYENTEKEVRGAHTMIAEVYKEIGGKYSVEQKPFLVKSDRVRQLALDYVSEERDAWAHAIRVLRFYRKQGIDLEPQLKTREDIEKHVHDKLGTYQVYIESALEPSPDIKKFSIKRKHFRRENESSA